MKAIPMVAGSIVWIDLDRAPVVAFGDRPIKVVANSSESESAIGLGRSWIKIDGLTCRVPGGRRAFSEGLDAEHTEPVVVVSYTRVSEGVFGIEFDGVVIAFERLGKSGFGITAPIIAAAQI